jgi:hypothetical protein
MRAVWSFWTKPFRSHHKNVWLTERHHLLSWVLSVQTAKQHYPETALFTDADGARLLVDHLGLEFTHVSTALTALRAADPAWWVLGKLWTYRAQEQAFVHLDSDVFLWRRLPPRLERSGVFAQNPETFPPTDDSWYRPNQYDQALRCRGGWAPREWGWYTSRRINTAICCGFVGGRAVEFLRYYADRAITMILRARNQAVWTHLGSPIGDNILLEQYLLAACIEYHRGRQASKFRDVDIEYLFQSSDEAFDETTAARVGYTHLIGGAKSNAALLERLEARVRRDYPDLYERCVLTPHASRG